MTRVTAPGLPPWPRLLFDPQRRQAVVDARYATWRSHEWANRAAEGSAWLGCGLVGWAIWRMLPEIEFLWRLLALLLIAALLFPIALPAIRITLRGFLARQLFATRTIVWFSEEAIAFRSRIHVKPVVIWRSWKGNPVKGRFVLQKDLHAWAYSNGLSRQRKAPSHHLTEAMVLEVVLTSLTKPNTFTSRGQANVLRSITLAELSSHFATNFTMVYSAAAPPNRANHATHHQKSRQTSKKSPNASKSARALSIGLSPLEISHAMRVLHGNELTKSN